MSTTESFEAPWIEKHRPEFLADIVGNSEAVSRYNDFMVQCMIKFRLLFMYNFSMLVINKYILLF